MITRSQVLTRASTVWTPGTVPYSQSTIHQPDGYRQDCSGYVSMCWAIPPGAGWGGESTVSLVTEEWMVEVPRTQLRPGDAVGLCGPGTAGDDGHIQLVAAYVPATGRASIWEQAGGGSGPTFRYLGGVNPSYRAYRYRGIIDEGGGDMSPVIVYCTDGSIWRSHANTRQRITEKQKGDITFWYPRAGYTPPVTVMEGGQIQRFAPVDMDIWGIDVATFGDDDWSPVSGPVDLTPASVDAVAEAVADELHDRTAD